MGLSALQLLGTDILQLGHVHSKLCRSHPAAQRSEMPNGALALLIPPDRSSTVHASVGPLVVVQTGQRHHKLVVGLQNLSSAVTDGIKFLHLRRILRHVGGAIVQNAKFPVIRHRLGQRRVHGGRALQGIQNIGIDLPVLIAAVGGCKAAVLPQLFQRPVAQIQGIHPRLIPQKQVLRQLLQRPLLQLFL